MDFSFTDDQSAIRDLAEKIFSNRIGENYWRDTFSAGEGFDRALWTTLGQAGLTGICVPEAYGGSDMGFVELCLILEAQGRFLAPVPLYAGIVLGGLPLAKFGSTVQKQAYLPGLADGSLLITTVLSETLISGGDSFVTATKQDDGWSLNGTVGNVSYGCEADIILVQACLGEASTVFIIPRDSAGLQRESQDVMNGEPCGILTFNGVCAGDDFILGAVGEGRRVMDWLRQRAVTALSAIQLGVAREALRRTAEYTTERMQFDRAVGSFQSVAHRAADAYIDVEAMNATLWRAAWCLAAGQKDDHAIETARWWACEGGHRVAHSAQHLHGGIGSDIEYPIHRYFLWAKQLEFAADGAHPTLARLGEVICNSDKEIRS